MRTLAIPAAAQAVLKAFVLALVGLGTFAPQASLADPSVGVKDITTFIKCLNDETAAGRIKSSADSTRCLPKQCSITLTMSDQSDLMACSLGTCQLTRVILACNGPAADRRFRPSFLMCPVGSRNRGQGEQGINRVELADDLVKLNLEKDPPEGKMKLADIAIPPNNFAGIKEDDALNKVLDPPLLTDGTKGCNVCHKNARSGGDTNFFSSIQVSGTLTAFDYLTRTLIQADLFDSLEGTAFTSGDFAIGGEAVATVNGIQTSVTFDVARTTARIEYEIRDKSTGLLLAGGIGEAGRALVELTTSAP